MTKNISKPIIMVGPGTGIAPFRAICMKRKELMAQGSGVNFSPVFVYFGCRFSRKDHIYKQEFIQLLQDKVISGYSVAFSRDQESKVYVQDKLMADREIIYNSLVKNNGIFMVAGSANKMPKDIREALKLIIKQESGWTEEETIQFLKKLEREKRYFVETW